MDTVIYTVRKGDTLFNIAKKYFTTVNMIARYNGIADPDVIYEGQLLRIPVSEIPKMKKENDRQATTDYIVKRGDTLAEIASKYGINVQKLAAFNNIDNPNEINEGQVLKIPLYYVPVKRPQSYTVKSGDTLSGIAADNNTKTSTLAELNNISNPDVINEGQTILIPAENNNEGRLEYIVKSGDSLWKIARMYGVSVPYLINLNRITNPDLIYPDQVIIIRK